MIVQRHLNELQDGCRICGCGLVLVQDVLRDELDPLLLALHAAALCLREGLVGLLDGGLSCRDLLLHRLRQGHSLVAAALSRACRSLRPLFRSLRLVLFLAGGRALDCGGVPLP
eukprot:8776121-Pyramimonas_sp.AAC.1